MRQHILEVCGNHRLWMNAYTASQFEHLPNANICVDEHFLEHAEKGDFCFAEDVASVRDIQPQLEALYIYRWNRSYPFDLSFKDSMEELHLHLVSTADLVGSSHEKITEEIWKP